MDTSFGIALSGLSAASKRLQVSANNVANQHSTKSRVDGQVVDRPYVPKQVQQVSVENGGVTTVVRDKEPATVQQYNPGDQTLRDVPNVNLEEEVVNQIIASYDYKANLQTIKVQSNLDKDLLNIVS